jgi:clan AA aspartic protease
VRRSLATTYEVTGKFGIRAAGTFSARAGAIIWVSMYVTVSVRVPGAKSAGYEALFLVDTGATDSMAPASRLTSAGILPVGRTAYELADGTVHEYQFGLAQIEFMGEVTAGRVIFGPEGVEPILGVTALESVGVTLDPATHTLKRLPAVPLK